MNRLSNFFNLQLLKVYQKQSSNMTILKTANKTKKHTKTFKRHAFFNKKYSTIQSYCHTYLTHQQLRTRQIW